MNITPDQIHAAARVFYEDQTGSDNYDTSAYRASWYRVAERAINAAMETVPSWCPTEDDLGYADEPETIDDGETRREVRR